MWVPITHISLDKDGRKIEGDKFEIISFREYYQIWENNYWISFNED